MAAAALSAEIVAAALLEDGTARAQTLAALEAVVGPHEMPLVLAAVPALAELMIADADTRTFRRACLLLARMGMDSLTHRPVFFLQQYGATFGDGKLARCWASDESAVARSLRAKPVEELGIEAAENYACLYTPIMNSMIRGISGPCIAVLGSSLAFLTMSRKDDMITRLARSEPQLYAALPMKMTSLLLDLVRGGVTSEGAPLPGATIGGAYWAIFSWASATVECAKFLVQAGLCDLAMVTLRAVGSPAQWVSVSQGADGQSHAAINLIKEVMKSCSGEQDRPDHEAFVSSGLFDELIDGVKAVASGQVPLDDVNHMAFGNALNALGRSGLERPDCQQAIRGIATELAFCLENSLEMAEDIGASTAQMAAQVCCRVFGRDEGGSKFRFTQSSVDTMLERWSQQMQASGWHIVNKPTPESVQVLELVISDVRPQEICRSL